MGQKTNTSFDEEITLKEIIISFRGWLIFLSSKWLSLLIITLFGMLIGGGYTFFSKPVYQSTATFVLDEDNQSNPLGALSGLSMLGVNANTNADLFSGDNLMWLYTSNRMIGETLMTVVDSAGNPKLLLNWFVDIDKDIKHFIEKVKRKHSHYKGFFDTDTMEKLDLDQNSVLNVAINIIRNNYLTIATEDKTTGIINVTMTSKNELFSYQFVKKIVAKVNEFYIATKTKKMSDQVAILQKKVDEFNRSMNTSMYQAAGAADAVPNPNSSLQTLKVAPQRKIVDVQVNSAIYTTMVQQLEAAKVALAKETPLIQIVDEPVLPLPIKRPTLLKCLIIGGLVFLILGSLIVIGKEFYNQIISG